MKNIFRKYALITQLSIVFIVIVIVSIAILIKAIELATGISIYAVLIAIIILLISINEIRNRLRPWVAVVDIVDMEVDMEKTFFTISNSGTVPATQVVVRRIKCHFQENGKWEEIKKLSSDFYDRAKVFLFPNQRIFQVVSRNVIEKEARGKEIKLTFEIEYRGLWSKHTTTNAFKFIRALKVWEADEPQDYT